MNYERIYRYRFQGIDKAEKISTWKVISEFIYEKLGRPEKIIDPAAGDCEFINQVRSKEKWAIDRNPRTQDHAGVDVKVIIADYRDADLPKDYFDAVYVSNFLEHLPSQEEVAAFLERMYRILKPGGTICVMGPNFKYCYRMYFDFADHTTILSDVGAVEHLYGAGFEITEAHPRFLPLSFRSRLPTAIFLVRLYLALPLAWRFLGKQFLLIGKKE